jgi:hypothetical protein
MGCHYLHSQSELIALLKVISAAVVIKLSCGKLNCPHFVTGELRKCYVSFIFPSFKNFGSHFKLGTMSLSFCVLLLFPPFVLYWFIFRHCQHLDFIIPNGRAIDGQ